MKLIQPTSPTPNGDERVIVYVLFDAQIPLFTRTRVSTWVDAFMHELRGHPMGARGVYVGMIAFGMEAKVVMPLTPLLKVRDEILRYVELPVSGSYRSSSAAYETTLEDLKPIVPPDAGGRGKADPEIAICLIMGSAPSDPETTTQTITKFRANYPYAKLYTLTTHADTPVPQTFPPAHSLYALSQPVELRKFVRDIMMPSNPASDAQIGAVDHAPVALPPIPQAGEQAPIFISYQRGDWDEFVSPLVDRLRGEGVSVWIDQHLIEGGVDWMDTINSALERCGEMILCVSPEALASRYVKYEYRYFFNNDKRIYPLLCRPAKIPPELATVQYYAYNEIDIAKMIALIKAR